MQAVCLRGDCREHKGRNAQYRIEEGGNQKAGFHQGSAGLSEKPCRVLKMSYKRMAEEAVYSPTDVNTPFRLKVSPSG